MYFGITSKQPKKRWENGAGYRKNNCESAVYNAILKYGWENIEHIVLYENLTKEEACVMEQELIAKYKTNIRRHGNDYGYNMTDGGEGALGHKVSEATRERARKMFSEFSGSNHYRARAVICNDKEWETVTAFCKENNVTHAAFEKWLDGRNAMPVYWYNKHLHYKDEEFDTSIIKPQEHPFKQRVEYEGKIFPSQKEFAKYIGVSPACVCKWIKKDKIPQYILDKGFKLVQ